MPLSVFMGYSLGILCSFPKWELLFVLIQRLIDFNLCATMRAMVQILVAILAIIFVPYMFYVRMA